ncbi:MAG: hypothetical protein KatS3mg124_0270 [Porticoccaceae bacterium]|nr:MAG: hypothetical protein KatS3mg124_0270 [Porticoccaceae bacterium]
MDPTHSQALRELLDRQAIWQVLQRLARGLDRLDVELVRSCYFDDAVDDHGHYVGDPDGFIAWANETARQFRWTHHALTTHNCELAGDDAYCETYFLYVGVRETAAPLPLLRALRGPLPAPPG